MPHKQSAILDSIPSVTLTQLLSEVHPSVRTHRFSPPDVVEIQGPPASGKTHLLYHLLIDCIIPHTHQSRTLGGWGKAAVVFDMDRTFDIVRFNQLLLGRLTRLLPLDIPLAQDISETSLGKLRIFRPDSSAQLAATIANLPRYHSAHLQDDRIGLVAVDSISAHYWPDRFTTEQMRSAHEPGSHAQTFTPPLQHILTALESFRRSQRVMVVVTNWGLHPVNASFPTFYRQHLYPFPAPFPDSRPSVPRLNATVVASPTYAANMLTLTHHVTLCPAIVSRLHQDMAVENHTREALRDEEILASVRTPNSTTTSDFVLYITPDTVFTG